MAESQKNNFLKITIFWIVFLALLFGLFEVLASTILMYRYRSSLPDSAEVLGEVSQLSTINLLDQATKGLGNPIGRMYHYQRYKKETYPEPFFQADPKLGYSSAAGTYQHVFFMRQGADADWLALNTKVTMNEDGSRWTGDAKQDTERNIYIFGDSVIFGTGVNDEQTFSYLLQQAQPEAEVKLYALGGYSLTQSYLRFNEIKDTISSDDIIVLGYADFYDSRNVMSPSRLRARRKWTTLMDKKSQDRSFILPRVAKVENGEIEISYIQERCSLNNSYCEGNDPARHEMTEVSAALINYIASNTDASVYVMHFNGSPNNPMLELTQGVTHISVLPEDFDSFVKDDIEGFDPHPGPYWHYAISRRLLEVLPDA
jgi:hypothetical protein